MPCGGLARGWQLSPRPALRKDVAPERPRLRPAEPLTQCHRGTGHPTTRHPSHRTFSNVALRYDAQVVRVRNPSSRLAGRAVGFLE
ncbi:unnamed protein product, partial [Iphiclides podalirius]